MAFASPAWCNYAIQKRLQRKERSHNPPPLKNSHNPVVTVIDDSDPRLHDVINVNVHVYSPDIPVGSTDYTICNPGIGTHSFTVSFPLGRIQHLLRL